jgi:hypothetical protein
LPVYVRQRLFHFIYPPKAGFQIKAEVRPVVVIGVPSTNLIGYPLAIFLK